jgi:hypothetical protein
MFGQVVSAQTWEPYAGVNEQVFSSYVIATATMKPTQLLTMSAAGAVISPKTLSSAEEQLEAALARQITTQSKSAGAEGSSDESHAEGGAAAEDQSKDSDDSEGQLGDPMSVIGVQLEGVEGAAHVRLVVEASPFLRKSTFDGELDGTHASYDISPKLSWDFEALARHRQVMPLNVTYTLQVGDGEPEQKVLTVTLRPINDCMFGMQVEGDDNKPQWFSTSFLFAAYANESHPWIDKLLRETLDQGVVKSFAGNQQAADAAETEVFAIWHTFQRRGFTYSSITATAAETPGIGAQHVRLFDEAIVTSQANCADGTLLFASVLRKIDIEPFMVHIPGHMFLAFKAGNGADARICGLETTMVGLADLRAADNLEASITAWRQARAKGDEELSQAAEAILKNPAGHDYELISLGAARSMGIQPLPYRPVEP